MRPDSRCSGVPRTSTTTIFGCMLIFFGPPYRARLYLDHVVHPSSLPLVSKVLDWGPWVGGCHEIRILPDNISMTHFDRKKIVIPLLQIYNMQMDSTIYFIKVAYSRIERILNLKCGDNRS